MDCLQSRCSTVTRRSLCRLERRLCSTSSDCHRLEEDLQESSERDKTDSGQLTLNVGLGCYSRLNERFGWESVDAQRLHLFENLI